jgi:hypothetical protein
MTASSSMAGAMTSAARLTPRWGNFHFANLVMTIAVAMLLDLRVGQATQMPWCAVTSKSDFYNCSLPTYEMCVQEVIAGQPADFAVRTRTTVGLKPLRPGSSARDSVVIVTYGGAVTFFQQRADEVIE